MPEIGDHYHPAGDESPVYRVVGVADGIALLRVTDADGRRTHTGDLRRVSRVDLRSEFDPAADPDAGFAPVAALRNLLQGMYWSVRRFL